MGERQRGVDTRKQNSDEAVEYFSDMLGKANHADLVGDTKTYKNQCELIGSML